MIQFLETKIVLIKIMFKTKIQRTIAFIICQLTLHTANQSFLSQQRTPLFLALRGGKECAEENRRLLTIPNRELNCSKFCKKVSTAPICTQCHSIFAEFGSQKSDSDPTWAQLFCKACKSTATSSASFVHIYGRCTNCSRKAVFGKLRTPRDLTLL